VAKTKINKQDSRVREVVTLINNFVEDLRDLMGAENVDVQILFDKMTDAVSAAREGAALKNAGISTVTFDPEEMHIDENEGEKSEIVFAILRKYHDYVDYTCPFCNKPNKIALRGFPKHPFKEHVCPECHKDFILKLEFKEFTRSYR